MFQKEKISSDSEYRITCFSSSLTLTSASLQLSSSILNCAPDFKLISIHKYSTRTTKLMCTHWHTTIVKEIQKYLLKDKVVFFF